MLPRPPRRPPRVAAKGGASSAWTTPHTLPPLAAEAALMLATFPTGAEFVAALQVEPFLRLEDMHRVAAVAHCDPSRRLLHRRRRWRRGTGRRRRRDRDRRLCRTRVSLRIGVAEVDEVRPRRGVDVGDGGAGRQP